jgi:hypothetical protein
MATVALLLAVGILVAVFIPNRTTDASLQGPSKGEAPVTVADAVSITGHDFPQQWTSNDEAGPCIAGKDDGTPGKPYCGNPPFPGIAREDETFARCIGVPISHVSMLTGTDELGEPYTYSSSTYTAPSTAAPDTLSSDDAPEAQSFFTLEPSASRQASDLAAFAKPSLIPCLETWEQTSPVMAFVQGLASAAGARMTFSAPVIRRISIPSTSGVHVIAFAETLIFRTPTIQESLLSEEIIMGAGRVESVLNLSGSATTPFPAALARTLVARQEQRVAAVAAS